jgi:hypothetical protein
MASPQSARVTYITQAMILDEPAGALSSLRTRMCVVSVRGL